MTHLIERCPALMLALAFWMASAGPTTAIELDASVSSRYTFWYNAILWYNDIDNLVELEPGFYTTVDLGIGEDKLWSMAASLDLLELPNDVDNIRKLMVKVGFKSWRLRVERGTTAGTVAEQAGDGWRMVCKDSTSYLGNGCNSVTADMGLQAQKVSSDYGFYAAYYRDERSWDTMDMEFGIGYMHYSMPQQVYAHLNGDTLSYIDPAVKTRLYGGYVGSDRIRHMTRGGETSGFGWDFHAVVGIATNDLSGFGADEATLFLGGQAAGKTTYALGLAATFAGFYYCKFADYFILQIGADVRGHIFNSLHFWSELVNGEENATRTQGLLDFLVGPFIGLRFAGP